MTYLTWVHTVVETPEFLAAAKRAGMSDAERAAAVDLLAGDPKSGEIIEGGGGVRKVRLAKQGGGKSGGYRVITYYIDGRNPVFLLTVISKGKRADLTEKQKQQVRASAKAEKNDRSEYGPG